jgi:plasmid stability protein
VATIQVRNVPEDGHRRLQERAVAAGMSLQEYVLNELTTGASQRTPSELIAEVERRMRRKGREGFARGTSAGSYLGGCRGSPPP